MPFHLEQPLWLLLGLAGLPMAIIALWAFASMSRLRRVLAGLVRLTLIAVIALILAGIATIRQTDRLAVIAVVDVSGSVQRQPADGIDRIEGATASLSTLEAIRGQLARAAGQRGRNDLLGIIAFDGKPILIAAPAPPSAGSDLIDRPLDYKIQEGTNIADALSLAAALVPSDATGRILLFSDGVQTGGDALGAARRIASARIGDVAGSGRGVPIDVVPIRYTLRPEVLIESVDAPPLAAVGAPVTIRAVIRTTDATSGTVRVMDNDVPVDINGAAPGASRRFDLVPGPNLFIAEVPVGVSRVHRFKVIYEPDPPGARPAGASGEAATPGDRLVENNTGEAFTITPSIGSVLLVDGVSEFSDTRIASPLAKTLRDADINVTVVSSGAMPTDLLSLQNYDLVILENVPADAVAPAAQQALLTHVKDMGAGLVMIGGPMSFGAGGWKGSPLEPIIPVKLELPDTLVEPEAAIVFVLDNSGSMGRSVMGSSRSQQEIANESAARAVLTLSRADLIGIITFNSRYEVLVPLAGNTQPVRTAAAIRGIDAGGGTNAGPALDEARRQLSAVTAKVKHVVLLSDGKSANSERLPELAKQMHEEGITVSAISVGDNVDSMTMEAIAKDGGGKHYLVTNPNILPRIFLKAIRIVRTPMYREERFDPVMTDDSLAALRGLGALPALGGLNLTQARPEPTIVNAMTSPKGEPVLAWWRAELGQVAAFTSDAGDWAVEWIGWPGYSQFWAQMARSLSRPTQDRLFRAQLEARGAELAIRIEAVDDEGQPLDFLEMPASVYSPSGVEIPAVLRQTASGIYESTIPADETGTYVAVLRPSAEGRRYSPVLAGASVRTGLESQRLESDAALVESLARTSGGRTFELADLATATLFDRQGIEPHRTLLSLVHVLLPWTLALLMLDIAMRRIAWDRLVIRDPTVAAGDMQSLAARLVTTPAAHGSDHTASPAAFTQRDAEELARAQKDRRLAERLAAARQAATVISGTDPASPTTSEHPRPSDRLDGSTQTPGIAADAQDTGLAAAKRRARKRFEE